MEIKNNSADRNNFTIIPNFVFTIGLSPYALSLYAYIKQTTGESGRCYKSTSTIADDLKMSAGMVTKAKQELKSNGLVEIELVKQSHGGKDYHSITILDVWQRNAVTIAERKKERSQGEQANSPSEIASSPYEFANSPSEPIKNPDNKNQEIKNNLGAASAQTPKKQSRTKKPVEPKSEIPPAVLAYREIRRTFPRKELFQSIDSTVGRDPQSLELWKQVLIGWAGQGWNPQNVNGALEFFKRGEIPQARGQNVIPFRKNGEGKSAQLKRVLFGGDDGEQGVGFENHGDVIDGIPIRAAN